MNDDYMISFQNETKQTIEASYKKMTAVERSVADFFIGNKERKLYEKNTFVFSVIVHDSDVCKFKS